MGTVGYRIRCARETLGMTQESLGKLCGTTKQTIFKYENDIVTNIPMDRIEAIASHLNVTPAFLMGWDNTDGSSSSGNIIRIAGRDGSFVERELTDQQLAALQAILDQMPDVPEGL